MQKSHNAKRGKGGFTLAELSVVLALLVIVGTMIISFSALMSGFAAENKAQYEYLEDHTALREMLCTWVAENDLPDSVFSVAEDGALTVAGNGGNKIVRFADAVLFLGESREAGFDAIDGVSFSTNGKLETTVHSTRDAAAADAGIAAGATYTILEKGVPPNATETRPVAAPVQGGNS